MTDPRMPLTEARELGAACDLLTRTGHAAAFDVEQVIGLVRACATLWAGEKALMGEVVTLRRRITEMEKGTQS